MAFKSRQRGDEFFTRGNQCRGGSVETFGGASADDLLEFNRVRLRDPGAKDFDGGTRVAIRELQAVLHAGDHLLRWAVGVLISAKNDGATLLADAVSRHNSIKL